MQNYKQLTIQTYDTYPESFDDKFTRHFHLRVQPFADQFLSHLKGKRVLDLGSGSGAHAAYFQEKGCDVSCIDLSEEMIAICLKRGLKAEVGDIEHVSLVSQSFDGIWCHAALLHIPKVKIPTIIEHITQSLVPGGILDVAVKEGEGEVMEPHEDYPGTQRLFVYFSEQELRDLFSPYYDIIAVDRTYVSRYTFINLCMRKKEYL